MTRGLHAGMYNCLVLFLLVKSSDTAVRFTKQPVSKLYVLKRHTAKFTWDYHVDNINIEFDSQSPRWYFHNYSYMIGYGDAFDGRRFRINTNTCPARLRTPTVRVSVEGRATLVITNVTLADSGTYGCRLALSSGLSISMPTSQAQLIVEVARFTNVPANKLYVVKGQTAKLTWDYHVDNINTEFDSQSPRWYFHSLRSMIGYGNAFDGRKFRGDRTCPARLRTPTVRVSVEDKPTLVIKNLTMADSGTYGCLLFLLSGYLHSMPKSEVELIVTDKPTVGKASSTTNISSWAGNTINLQCYWSSSLPIPRWTWFKPNGDRITNVRSISSGSEVTVLTGNNNHDYGMYRCKAMNIAGSDHHNISVTRLFPPVRPPLIDVASIRSSSVTIIWARPADNSGSPVTGYKVLIDSRTFYINSSKILVYQEITGLQEHTEYNVTVLARNIAGFGDAYFKVFNTTTAKQEPKCEPRHASTQDNCNTKVGVLSAFLAISLLSIVILLASIILEHRRTNLQNSNQQKPKKDAVYENSDAIGMVHLTSSSSPSFKTNQKSHKTALHTEARNPNQEHYQQLNPSTLQSSTATVPTYEPLRKNDVTIVECKGHHTHPTLQSRTRGYKNP